MRIIVGYTNTPTGADALALGVGLARSYGARLDVVLVLHSEARPTLAPADAGYERFLHETAGQWLADAAATVPDAIESQTHIVYAESFAEGLIETSADLGGDMIVVGASRGGLLGRITIGSVANVLLHSAVVPVVLAPAGFAESGEASLTRVTCAIGTRAGADELLDAAIIFARAAGVPLRLVSLVALDLPTPNTHPAVVLHASKHADEVLAYAKSHLPEGIEVETLTASGSRIEEAVASLDWLPGELALVGSSRLAQSGHLFLGATAAKMLRELPAPMVVVPRDSVLTIDSRSPQGGEK